MANRKLTLDEILGIVKPPPSDPNRLMGSTKRSADPVLTRTDGFSIFDHTNAMLIVEYKGSLKCETNGCENDTRFMVGKILKCEEHIMSYVKNFLGMVN